MTSGIKTELAKLAYFKILLPHFLIPNYLTQIYYRYFPDSLFTSFTHKAQKAEKNLLNLTYF